MSTCVLVVDDDEGLRDVVAEAIADAGYSVAQASNGQEALAYLRNESPCLMLLDLMMPVMDGWQLVEHMDKDPRLSTVPICVVSAQTQLPLPRSACVLKKPVSLESLLETIEQYCRKAAC